MTNSASRRLLAVGLLALLTTVGHPAPAQAAEPVGEIRRAGGATAIADSYIVVLRTNAAAAAVGTTSPATANNATVNRLSRQYGATVERVYDSVITGFSARMSAATARRLAAHPAVAYVEQDHVVAPLTAGVQLNPPSWGLDRIDQRNLPLNQRYAYPNTAPNVRAYVIDTGIHRTHSDFGGRVSTGFDVVDGGPADDCNGHGTHVAGTIGGRAHGVAKAVRLVPVRVLNCSGSGSISGVIAGIDWVTANAVKPAVASMALGGGASATLDAAVVASIRSGVTYAVAAGGSNSSACNTSPARVPEALTVAGTTITDARMSSASYGSCLDLFAPGASITSTWHTGNSAVRVLSGSSMATAHVAGCAAVVASAHPTWTPAQVSAHITSTATTGVVSNPGTGSPNRLLYCA
ncbi:S8 family peptidase [Solwaraspora sp. WMMD406]|uniref:S8 family peptidase n=1 Tax=Solwaraspora sp. WMMD406 TaxID=3016095 RepID=UPI0024179F4B|nr:S8 family peptidase [Solwaraspora sp. WMMD406]MDG4766954.1 S8 family peptidase [Solwaraspora sp. WMMD406]